MKSLTNLTIKIISLAFLLNIAIFSQQDSLQSSNQNPDSVFVMTKSPWGAVLRSAILPGLGQIYNESYWKTGIIWGISAWLVYNWIDNNKLYKQNRDTYNANYSNDPIVLRRIEGYKTNRDFYRDQRDLFSIYIGLTYFLNLVDAYVDAQLFDFTVGENFYTRQPMLGIRFKF